ncbi:MAG: hypothetical protein JWP04_329 [Belnapia sp.]|nr:hypothetical protein [Belnapia sp.]
MPPPHVLQRIILGLLVLTAVVQIVRLALE